MAENTRTKIAIIGAGWMGIGCCRILVEKGYDVTVYERNNDIGGVWHPDNCYAGLSIHEPAITIEYFDYPLPGHIDRSERITSSQVYDYLKLYCQAKELYSHMIFNTIIEKVNYDTCTKKMTLYYRGNENSDIACSVEYDYIVYTHGFSGHSIPNFKGKEVFSGQIVHSLSACENLVNSLIHEDKKIVVLGASKTATDFMLNFYRHGYKVVWLYRINYWFLQYDPLSKIIKNKSTKKIHKIMFTIGDIIGTKSPFIHYWLWRLFNIIHTYGKKHTNFLKYHHGRIDHDQMRILKKLNKTSSIIGEIDNFYAEGIKLKDGRVIEADCIILCTGSGSERSLINIEIDHKKISTDDVYTIYRSRVIPEIPKLIFTAFNGFTLGTVNGLTYGNWIATYIESALDEEYLRRNAVKSIDPFFTNQTIFSSHKYINVVAGETLKSFFSSGELSKPYYVKWIWNYTFSGQAVKPLEFNKIKKSTVLKRPHDLTKDSE